ncbi:ATP-binding cassette domain-containing protein [Chitinophaga pinensis]|uniref:ABC transporter related n=1 Tax=Chitinophaga pinensis (strain ATCC 43595 / DSM 2588 / LMG 13176 / NBRC 15968 / NCIMB 11800 / UQM 2034) TaxID=485918 RepID=A0A979GYU7_CHIPD|nr:ATP-binding cassette domain-containing protein [Chitinophaga pinensis]ACU63484.1 ABC transporter related [Chitinophaga pinensis DSM 2588]
MPPENVLLLAENISAGYEKLKILDDVSFTVGSGQLLALIGRNGAGKSTLFNVIAGITDKWEGRVVINQLDITNRTSHFIYQHGISYMPQGGRIFNQLTVLENLLFNVKGNTIRKQNIVAVIEKVIAQHAPVLWEHFRNRILPRMNRNAGCLSGGERQAVSLIRTIINDSPVYFFDEPTSGLSLPVMTELQKLLHEKSKAGCAIVFIEQKINWSLSMCNKVMVMQRGRLVYTGEPDYLLNNETVLSGLLGAVPENQPNNKILHI